MDKETESIISEIKKLIAELKSRGINEDDISQMIEEPKNGRIILDKKGNLTLPDNGNIKIKLAPIERTLYILLLRHPEGIPVDELWRHYDELCQIYNRQTVYDDPELIRNAIEALCDDYKTTLYTNISRIKKKIIDKLGVKKARPYLITRYDDGTYRIDLPRTLVLDIKRNVYWEEMQ